MNAISKSDIDKHFGKVLREYRKKGQNYSRRISRKLGISLKYISRIENGNNGVKTQNLIQYMNILGIPPNDLYGKFYEPSRSKSRYGFILEKFLNYLMKRKNLFLLLLI